MAPGARKVDKEDVEDEQAEPPLVFALPESTVAPCGTAFADVTARGSVNSPCPAGASQGSGAAPPRAADAFGSMSKDGPADACLGSGPAPPRTADVLDSMSQGWAATPAQGLNGRRVA